MSTPTIIAISNFKQILTAVFKSNWVADRGEITKDILFHSFIFFYCCEIFTKFFPVFLAVSFF